MSLNIRTFKDRIANYGDNILGFKGFDFSGLIAYYPFDTDGSDLSSNANDAVQTGGTFSAAKFGNGFETDGTDRMDAADSASMVLSKTLTVNMWIKLDISAMAPSGSLYSGIISKGTDEEWELYYVKQTPSTNDYLDIYVINNFPSYRFVYGRANVSRSEFDLNFVMLTFIIDLNNAGVDRFKIYVNNVVNPIYSSSGSGGSITAFEDTNSELKIGTCDFANNMVGVIDELSIWNRVLTDEEITTLYNATKPLIE